jgi:hypothetical protein
MSHIVIRFKFDHGFCFGDTVAQSVSLGSEVEVDLTNDLRLFKYEVSWSDFLKALGISKCEIDNSLVFSKTLFSKSNVNIEV